MEEAKILELSDQDMESDFELLDAVIDFKLKGFYTEGLSMLLALCYVSSSQMCVDCEPPFRPEPLIPAD